MTNSYSTVLRLFLEKQKVFVRLARTIALEEDLAILVNVTALTVIKGPIVQSVYVQYFALHMVIMVGEFVTAKKDGKVRNVTYPWLNVNFPAAPITVVV